jgi:hypothetical protein
VYDAFELGFLEPGLTNVTAAVSVPVYVAVVPGTSRFRGDGVGDAVLTGVTPVLLLLLHA